MRIRSANEVTAWGDLYNGKVHVHVAPYFGDQGDRGLTQKKICAGHATVR